jgi:hypothetical protein
MDRKKVGVKGNVKVLLTDKYELKEEEKYLDLGNGKKLRMPIPHIDTFGDTKVIEEHNQVLISGLFEYLYWMSQTVNLPNSNQPQQLIVLYNNGSAVASLGISIYLVVNGNVGEWIIVAIDNSSNSYSFNSLSLFVTNWATTANLNISPNQVYVVYAPNSYQFASASITGQKTSNQALVIIWEITFTFPPNEFSPAFIWLIIGNTPNATNQRPLNFQGEYGGYSQYMQINYVGGSVAPGFNFIPSYDSSNAYLTFIGEYTTTSQLQILNITFVISDPAGTFQSPAITPAYASTPGLITGILTLIFTPT